MWDAYAEPAHAPEFPCSIGQNGGPFDRSVVPSKHLPTNKQPKNAVGCVTCVLREVRNLSPEGGKQVKKSTHT